MCLSEHTHTLTHTAAQIREGTPTAPPRARTQTPRQWGHLSVLRGPGGGTPPAVLCSPLTPHIHAFPEPGVGLPRRQPWSLLVSICFPSPVRLQQPSCPRARAVRPAAPDSFEKLQGRCPTVWIPRCQTLLKKKNQTSVWSRHGSSGERAHTHTHGLKCTHEHTLTQQARSHMRHTPTHRREHPHTSSQTHTHTAQTRVSTCSHAHTRGTHGVHTEARTRVNTSPEARLRATPAKAGLGLLPRFPRRPLQHGALGRETPAWLPPGRKEAGNTGAAPGAPPPQL